MNISIEVRNNGSAPSPATQVAVRVDQVALPALDVPTLAPGEASSSTLNATLAAGAHNVTATVDPARAVRQLHRDDDTARVAVLATPEPKVNLAPPKPLNATANAAANATAAAPAPPGKLLGVPGFEAWLLAPAAAWLLLRPRRGRPKPQP
ncbi:MAG: hypothetical protein LC624_08195 [Halobacteriales archaeon]|nr:hypothetical protein [Halobacteriales archaeon]